MSSRPKLSPAQKQSQQTARQKMQAAAAEQQRAAQLRRRGILAAVALTVVAAVTAVGIAIGDSNGKGSSGAAGRSTTGPAPAHTTGDGTTVVYGDPTATRTLDVYEDFRCPVCKALEKTDGETIKNLADQGKYKIVYHMGTFLDDNLGGTGSKQALAAAGAALNESPKLFKAFHDVLYANQPEETEDGFADQQHLLDLAAKVPGLVTPQFTKAVKEGTYLGWANRVSAAFNASGVNGTPTLKLDGRTLTVLTNTGPVSPADFTKLVG